MLKRYPLRVIGGYVLGRILGPPLVVGMACGLVAATLLVVRGVPRARWRDPWHWLKAAVIFVLAFGAMMAAVGLTAFTLMMAWHVARGHL